MDTASNPYAPSRASLASGEVRSAARLWRHDKVLIMARDGDLPRRCIKCNEVPDEPTPIRTVYWHHPGVYLVLLINALLYIIVALMARQAVKVSPGLCTRHKRRRTLGLCIGWVGFLSGLVMMVASFSAGYPLAGMIALLVMLSSMIAGIVLSRIVYAKRIDDRYVQLRGCGDAFLQELPEYSPGTRDF